MQIANARGMRALGAGVLVVMLVGLGAMPASAGAPGGAPGSKGQPGRPAAGAHGNGNEGGATAQRPGDGSGAAPPKSQGDAPRQTHQRAAARPPAAGRQPSPKPPGAAQEKREASDEALVKRAATEAPEPAVFAPDPTASGRPPEVAATPLRRSEPPAVRPAVRALSADVPTAMWVSPPEQAVPGRDIVRPLVAGVDLVPPKRWPTLPGPLGYPPFPAVLGAVLLGCVALGFRGDRRDPKLVAATIDARDDRARFG